MIIAGDFNDYNDGMLDRDPPDVDSIIYNRTWNTYFPVMDSAGLVDTFRYLHPEKREFSRNDKFRGSSARIDAILVSSSLANDVTNVQHIEYKRSDHKFVITSLRRREENQSQKLSIRSNSPGNYTRTIVSISTSS